MKRRKNIAGEKFQEKEFLRLQMRMTMKARKKGIFAEKQVERIVFAER